MVTKSKFWDCTMYPENMIDDWQSCIDDVLEYPFAYCIHDKDTDKEGKLRKLHVHIILAYGSPTTEKSVRKLFDKLCVSGKQAYRDEGLRTVSNIRRAYDYLIHDTDAARRDHKYQYDASCRVCGNNFDIGAYEQVSTKEKHDMRTELSDFVIDNHITNYVHLFSLARKMGPEYVDVLCGNSGHFREMCRGAYLYQEAEKKRQEFEELCELAHEVDEIDDSTILPPTAEE